jgi:hypothetical protein
MHSGEISVCSPPYFVCFGQCTSGLLEPEGPCSPGHYCSHGANSSTPTDGVTGGLCGGGHVSHFVNFPRLLLNFFLQACTGGATHPSPINGIGGYTCPASTQCPPGSSEPEGCPPAPSILSRLSIWIIVTRPYPGLSSPPLLSHQIWRSDSLPQWNLRSC